MLSLQKLPSGPEVEELFRLMVDSLDDYAVCLLDNRGNILTWNDAAQRNKGYAAREIIGRNYSCFFPEEAIKAGAPENELEIARRSGRFREEGWRVRNDGSRFWAEVTLAALKEPSGALLGFAKITRDLTARRNQEEALREAKEVAEAADRAKSEFLANMSHELRTPLNAVLGFSELLQTEMFGSLTSDKNREYARHIHASGAHLLALINDILDVSKLDAQKLQLALEMLDLVGLARESLQILQPQADAAGVALELEAPRSLQAQGDPRRLHQILFNLLSNAIKFTPSGGRVTVSIAEQPQLIKICVKDTGIGMAQEDIPVAMSRFGQVESVLSRRVQGTGLGLPLVKQLVEMHGGEFALESQPGIGTSAIVSLPKNEKCHNLDAVARPNGSVSR